MNQDTKNLIIAGLHYLAAVDDGAEAKDDCGFNKFDTAFGRSLAACANFTDGQLAAAHKLIWRYNGQLKNAGIVIPNPDEIPQNGSRPKAIKRIDVADGFVLIYFGGKPTTEERTNLDKLPYRRWNPDKSGMPWETPAANIKAVESIFGNCPNWDYSDAYHNALKSAPVQPQVAAYPEPKIDVADSGTILFYFGGPPAKEQRGLLDQLNERRWNPDRDGKPWEAPARLIEQVFELFPSANYTQEFKAELQKRRELSKMSRSANSIFTVDGLNGSLFPYQSAGVEFIEKSNGRVLLADEMGLGKTIQAIAYLQLHPELRPAVIVVPASLKINWEREIRKWMSSNKTVSILSGQKPNPDDLNADIYIINYEILSYWVDAIIAKKPQALIVDEAHRCKNFKAARTKAVQKIAKITKAFIPMTGTPIRNRPMELFTQLNMISPKEWGNWFKYAERYQNYVRGYGLGEAQNLEELHQLIKPYMIRRTKAEVMKELPEKVRTTIVMEFDPTERKTYNDYISEAAVKSGADQLAMIEKAKQAAARGKLPAVLDWISEFLETGEKLVVFANHREITQEIYRKFQDQAVMLIGGLSQKARQDAVDRFQGDDTIRLFVGNLEAAGVGITLTAASNVAIVEFPWTPDTVDQAIDRCHRIGQMNSVTAWHLVAEDTIEEKIVELLQAKAAIIHDVMDKGHIRKEFSILDDLNKIIRTETKNIGDTINGS